MSDYDVNSFFRRLVDGAVKGSDLEELPDMEPLVEGVLYRDSLAWMVGPSGHGKTFLGIDIAASVSEGMQWHGHETHSGNVLYVIAEPGKLKTRVHAWKEEHEGTTAENMTFLPLSVLVCDPVQKAAFLKYVKKLKPVLVVFDTQARMTLGMEENSAKEMGQYVAAMDEIREATGACVLTIHHPDKANVGMRGSNVTLGAAQTVIAVEKKAGYVEVTFPKQKDDEDGVSLFFNLTPSHGSLVPEMLFDDPPTTARVSKPRSPRRGGGRGTSGMRIAKEKGSSQSREETRTTNARVETIRDFVQANPGCSVRDIVNGTKVPRATIYRAIKSLKESATVITRSGKLYVGSSHEPSQKPVKRLRPLTPKPTPKKALKRPQERPEEPKGTQISAAHVKLLKIWAVRSDRELYAACNKGTIDEDLMDEVIEKREVLLGKRRTEELKSMWLDQAAEERAKKKWAR